MRARELKIQWANRSKNKQGSNTRKTQQNIVPNQQNRTEESQRETITATRNKRELKTTREMKMKHMQIVQNKKEANGSKDCACKVNTANKEQTDSNRERKKRKQKRAKESTQKGKDNTERQRTAKESKEVHK